MTRGGLKHVIMMIRAQFGDLMFHWVEFLSVYGVRVREKENRARVVDRLAGFSFLNFSRKKENQNNRIRVLINELDNLI